MAFRDTAELIGRQMHRHLLARLASKHALQTWLRCKALEF